MLTSGRKTGRAAMLAVIATSALAGCGGIDGVEVNAPVLSTLGIVSEQRTTDPKVEARPGLVLPPNTGSLPPPAEGQASIGNEPWPNDPDILAQQTASAEERKRKEYEDKGDWSDNRDISEFDKLMDERARKPGILGSPIFERKAGE